MIMILRMHYGNSINQQVKLIKISICNNDTHINLTHFPFFLQIVDFTPSPEGKGKSDRRIPGGYFSLI